MNLKSPIFGLALAALLLAGGCSSDDDKDKDKADAAASDASGGDASGGDTSGDAVSGDGEGGDGVAGDGGGDGGGDAGSDTEAGKTHQTCSALGDCVIAACAPKKFEKGCSDACIADSAEAVVVKGLPLLACVQNTCLPKCATSSEPSCLDDCMSEQCIGDLVACVSDGVESKGDKSCVDTMGCFEGCGIAAGKPFACMSTCIGATAAASAGLLKGVIDCVVKATKDGADPEQACMKPMIQCATNGATGTAKCHEAFVCLDACKADEKGDDCEMACFGSLSAEAQDKFFAAAPCLGEGGSKDGEDGEPKEADPTCGPKVLACVDPSGDKTCVETMGCIEGCQAKAGEGQDGGGCAFACIHDTKKAEAGLIMSVMTTCGGDEAEPPPVDPPGQGTPTEPDDAPPSKACMEAMLMCANPAETGQKCPELLQCIGACEDDKSGGQACGMACAAKGAKAEVKHLVDFIACGAECSQQCKDSTEQGCEGTCMAKNCADAVKACAPPT
jgi:hypothetical protein